MKLKTATSIRRISDTHNRIIHSSGDRQLVGDPRSHQGMITTDLQRVGQPLEHPLARMLNKRRLAVENLTGAPDGSAIMLNQCLVPETDSDDWQAANVPLEQLGHTASLLRMAGAGRKDQDRIFRGSQTPFNRGDINTVSENYDMMFGGAQLIDEVVCERVKIIEQYDVRGHGLNFLIRKGGPYEVRSKPLGLCRESRWLRLADRNHGRFLRRPGLVRFLRTQTRNESRYKFPDRRLR